MSPRESNVKEGLGFKAHFSWRVWRVDAEREREREWESIFVAMHSILYNWSSQWKWENAAAGAVAGLTTVVALHPLDIVRTRFQGLQRERFCCCCSSSSIQIHPKWRKYLFNPKRYDKERSLSDISSSSSSPCRYSWKLGMNDWNFFSLSCMYVCM